MKRKAGSMARIVFVRTMAAFLVFWALMVAVIAHLNYGMRLEAVSHAESGATAALLEDLPNIISRANWRRKVNLGLSSSGADYLPGGWWLHGAIQPGNSFRDTAPNTLENTAKNADLPAIMEYTLLNGSYDRGTRATHAVRVYNAEGKEMARTPITIMEIRDQYFYNTSYICFDSILDDQGQLALADQLYNTTYPSRDGDRSPSFFNIPQDDYSRSNYGEVTGILDENRIYPREIAYIINGERYQVFSSNHEMFQDAELETVQFAYAAANSILSPDRKLNPETLAAYHRAQALLDGQEAPGGTVSYQTFTYEHSDEFSLTMNRCSDGRIFTCAYVWDNTTLTFLGLGPTFQITLLCALILAALASWWLSRSLSKPLSGLTKAVEANEDVYDQSTPVSEVNTLAAAFQSAQSRLKEDLEREQSLTHAMAHELKTPLGVIRSYAEALEDDISPHKRGYYLAVLQQEADSMDALILRLLELSRLERGGALEKLPVNLSAAAAERAARLAPAMEDRGLLLEQSLEPVTVLGDATLLGQAAENFLTNALRHTVDGGVISLRVARAGDFARLSVENQGPPIPEADLPRLWDTFFKGDQARSRSAGGAGLGLAIVRQIVLLHGGRYGAENGEGTVRMWFEIPVG